MKLSHIQPKFIPMIAEDLIPYFKQSEERAGDGSVTVQGILHMIYSGQWSLWIVQDDDNRLKGVGCTLTTTDMVGHLVSHIMLLIGDNFDEWGLELLGEFEELALKNGVYSIEWEGREGWIRKIPGYTKVRTVMRKVLSDGRIVNENND